MIYHATALRGHSGTLAQAMGSVLNRPLDRGTRVTGVYKGTVFRRLGLSCVLILCGGVVAGCGGSLQQSVRQEARQQLGDGHPKILRIETVRDVAGIRLVVATLEASLCYPVVGSDPAVLGLGPLMCG